VKRRSHVDGIGWWLLALSVFAAGCASTPPPPGCRYFSRPRARPRSAPSITSTKRPMALRWVSPAFASASPGGPGVADRDELLELRHRLSARDQVQPALDLSRQAIVYFSQVDRALGFSSVLAGASRLGQPDISDLTVEEIARLAATRRLQAIDVTRAACSIAS
jgi:hypothetical protein